jgi:hypothetical protein
VRRRSETISPDTEAALQHEIARSAGARAQHTAEIENMKAAEAPPKVAVIIGDWLHDLTGIRAAMPESSVIIARIHELGAVLMQTLPSSQFDEQAKADAGVSMLKAVTSELKPENPIQATLIVQMLVVHSLAMDMARRAAGQTQIDTTMAMLGRMERLLRLYVDLAETLARLQRKVIAQKVIVERITSNPAPKQS